MGNVYKCCKPDCGNQLVPQGPISALVSSGGLDFNMSISIKEDAKLNDLSFQHIETKVRDLDDNVVKIKIEDKLMGDSGDFQIKSFHVELPNRLSGQVRRSYLTICCDKCGTCCEYSY